MAEKLSDNYTSSDEGPGFTCNEADALASVLAYSGHVEAARAGSSATPGATTRATSTQASTATSGL
jgi:hypothetical protein